MRPHKSRSSGRRRRICPFRGTAVSQVQINVLRDLFGDTIEVGAVKVPFWSAALAQDAQALTLENVRLTLGSTLFEAKRVEVAGLSGSRADLDALLSPTASEPLSVRMEILVNVDGAEKASR